MKVAVMFLLVVLFSVPCYGQAPYGTYVSPYSQYQLSSPYNVNPPKIYSGGTYLGELSSNRYAPDSVSNKYGQYGSRYSPTSINNPYGEYGKYRVQPVYVYPPRW